MNRSNRRRNIKIYPIYKMLSWDLLFFYAIQFLFLTMVKQITASEILIINGFYFFIKTILQLPAIIVIDNIGNKKSIILGNCSLIIYILMLILLPGITSVVIGLCFFAVGLNIKTIAESNLLYNSISTRGGNSLFSKIEARGGSLYYYLDGISSLLSGYLFVVNMYLPIFITLLFLIVATILALFFKDVDNKLTNKIAYKTTKIDLKEYMVDLKVLVAFIIKSKRLKAFILFQMFFYSIIEIMFIYNSELLITIGIEEEQFSGLLAIFTLISGAALTLKRPIEKKFKNRTLTFLSVIYVVSVMIFSSVINVCDNSMSLLPIILLMIIIQRSVASIWYIFKGKYIRNFTKEKYRSKIIFLYEAIGSLTVGISSALGGLLLSVIDIKKAFIIISLLAVAILVLVLDYMRTRIGLRPEKYIKEDIEPLFNRK